MAHISNQTLNKITSKSSIVEHKKSLELSLSQKMLSLRFKNNLNEEIVHIEPNIKYERYEFFLYYHQRKLKFKFLQIKILAYHSNAED